MLTKDKLTPLTRVNILLQSVKHNPLRANQYF